MKILVVSTSGAGHVTPLVPLIGALLAGGDEVLVASGPEAAPIVEKTGARFALAGRSEAEWMGRLATRTRGNPGDGVAGMQSGCTATFPSSQTSGGPGDDKEDEKIVG